MPTLEQKIGQLLIVGFVGTMPKDDFVVKLKDHIMAGKVGGVIHFRHNVTSPDQLAELNAFLQSKSPTKLFVAVDQEGGKVQRLRASNGFKDFPSAKTLGAISVDAIAASSAEMASMIRGVGCNLNFAPCVDLDLGCPVISGLDRSFSADPAQVVAAAGAFLTGHQSKGVLTAIKHFPGHGSASGDTHEDMTDVTDVYKDEELEPFKALARSADMVMTSHIFHRGWDSSMPATLSKVILDRLRSWGFTGVIVSDDLHMGAVQKKFRKPGHEGTATAEGFDLKTAVVGAFKAGVDVLILSNNPLAAKGVEGFTPDPDIVKKVIAAVQEAIQEGQLSEAEIDEKRFRVEALRSRV